MMTRPNLTATRSAVRWASLGLGLAALALTGPAMAGEDGAKEPEYAQVSAATAPVADAYFAAYIDRDWDSLEPLLADDADFLDPTGTLVFGPVGAEGKPAMMKTFREGYSGITEEHFTPMRVIHSGDQALYEGMLDWSVRLADGKVVSSKTPFVTILGVKDGKVITHRDYADYGPFLAALHEVRGDQG